MQRPQSSCSQRGRSRVTRAVWPRQPQRRRLPRVIQRRRHALSGGKDLVGGEGAAARGIRGVAVRSVAANAYSLLCGQYPGASAEGLGAASPVPLSTEATAEGLRALSAAGLAWYAVYPDPTLVQPSLLSAPPPQSLDELQGAPPAVAWFAETVPSGLPTLPTP